LRRKYFLSDTQKMDKSEPTNALRRRGSSAKSEQRIRDILRVAREVFAEKGYERATTTEVASRLGISEATVFTYFRGKRELCVRVIGDWYDEIIEAMARSIQPDQPLRVQLHSLLRTHLHLFLVQGTGLCALVLSEGRSKGQALGDSLQPLQRRYTAPLMDLLARGQASGEIRRDMPLRLLRSMVLGPMEHILWEAVTQDQVVGDSQIGRNADALIELLWSALRAPDQEIQALRRLQESVRTALARADGAPDN
jgi:AcrR family transcriptional regulator